MASQVFQEELPVAGTKLSLHYASDRVPGYRVNATLELPLIGASIPQNLNGADVEVEIAGRTLKQTFMPNSNLVASFQWDGRDVYHPQGASSVPIGGSTTAQVKLAYRYPLSYAVTALRPSKAAANYIQRSFVNPSSGIVSVGSLAPIFGLAGRQPSSLVHSGGEDAILTRFTRPLTIPDHRKAGFDGWSLTPHHFYDTTAKILYRGDGQQVKTDAKGRKVDLVYQSTPNAAFRSLAVGPNGDIYVEAGYPRNQILKITPAGQLVAVTADSASPGKKGFSLNDPNLDNKLAADVYLGSDAYQIRVGPDGSIYFAFDSTIWRLDKDERFHRVLCGSSGDQYGVTAPDGTFAYNAYRNGAYAGGANTIAISKDGSVYFNDSGPNPSGASGGLQMIRKIAPDGRIYTIAGLGGVPDGGASGDYYAGNLDIGQLALTARLRTPTSIAIGPDDSVYYGSGRFGIVHIKKNGILELVLYGLINNPVGYGDPNSSDEGKVAATAGQYGNSNTGNSAVQVTADGTIYFQSTQCAGPTCNPTIWKIDTDGILRRVGGRYFASPLQTGNALEADLGGDVLDLGFAPDGNLYLVSGEKSDGAYRSIRRISPVLPTFSATDLSVASEDGQELYVFDQNGRHLRTIDPLLNVTTWTFTYDTRGFVVSLRDRDGLVTTVERDSAGHATAIVGPYGVRTQLAVDVNGYLATITAPDQTQIQMTTSATGLLNAVTGPRQDTYSFTYDDMGRLTRGNRPSGGFTTLARSGAATDATVTATTAGGRVETRRIQRTPQGGTLTTLTNPDEVASTENKLPDGSRILNNLPSFQAEFDLAPDPRQGIAGQGNNLSVQRFTTPNGLKDEITATQQATLADPTNPLSITSFLDTSLVNGNQWTNAYDAATRTFTLKTPEARQLTLQVNAAGHLSKSQQGNLAAEIFSYDSFGRLTNTSTGNGTAIRSATIGYDAKGFQNFLHSPVGLEANITNNVQGRPVSIQLPGNRNVSITYGPDNRRTSVTPPDRTPYTFQFDPVSGQMTYKAPAIPGVDNTTVYSTNADLKLSSIVFPGGRHLDFQRAASGRVTGITNTFGDNFAFSYDSLGEITNLTQTSGPSLALTYTGKDISGVTWSGLLTGSITRQFDNAFRTSTEVVDGGTPIPFTYSADGLMISAGALKISWRGDANLPVSEQLANVLTSTDYNEFGEPVHTLTTLSGTPLLDEAQTLDNGGRVTSQVVDSVTTLYAYDAAGFLSSKTRNGTVVASYSYDSNGNLLSSVTPTGTTTYTYDAQDRLINAGTTTFTYTDAGEIKTRVTSAGTTSYSYDEFGQLRHVTLPDGRMIDYVLGTPGMRLVKKINGNVAQGLLRDDSGRILAELNGNNAVVSQFVYSELSPTPEYMIRGSDTFRIVTDFQGSVRLVVNAQTGAIAQRIEYDEWGLITLDTNPGYQPFGYAGGLYDKDTGLVRFGQRDYDASLRRWTTPDPIKFGGGSTNLYSYVNNDPLNQTDQAGTGPVAKLTEIKSADKNAPHLTVRRNGKILTPYEGMDLYQKDVITTDNNTVAAIEFSIGGRAGINRNSQIVITSERSVKSTAESPWPKISKGGMWAKCGKLKEPLEIQTNGGVTGIKG